MRRKAGIRSALGLALLWTGSALADPTAADRATARSLAGEGYQALQAKDYSTAADRFSRADALVHAPTLMIDWARALVGLGRLVEAQERYEQIIREGVDSKSPKSWQRALTDARNELAEIKPRLAWVTINIAGANGAKVTIDGVQVPPAAIGVRRAVNPGPRDLRVSAPGFLPQKMPLDLPEGGETTADFTLYPDPEAQVVAAPVPPPAAPPPPKPRSRAPAYVALAVGGAGFITGTVTGILALHKRSELSDACNSDKDCRPEDQGQLDAAQSAKDSYHTLGTISGVGLGVGVAGVGLGVTLLLLNRSTPAQPEHGLTLRPYVGLGTVGALGSF